MSSTARSAVSLVVVLLVHASLARAQTAPAPPPPDPADALAPKPDAARAYPVAARFAPGEQAAVEIQAVSPTNTPFTGPVELTVFHLNDQVYRATSDPITLRPDATLTTSFKWMPPPTDFTGYLAVMSVGGRVIGSTGIDVSSTALGYPRYGYLSNFSPNQTPEVINPIVQRLARDYHLNVFQFYDWFWRHEKLIERDQANLLPTWEDLFGRTHSVQVLSDLISSVHGYNALALAYVMIYAARENYAELWPIKPSWGLFTQPNAVSQLSLDFSTQKPGERLFLFDPSNPDWQALDELRIR